MDSKFEINEQSEWNGMEKKNKKRKSTNTKKKKSRAEQKTEWKLLPQQMARATITFGVVYMFKRPPFYNAGNVSEGKSFSYILHELSSKDNFNTYGCIVVHSSTYFPMSTSSLLPDGDTDDDDEGADGDYNDNGDDSNNKIHTKSTKTTTVTTNAVHF